MIRLVAFDVAGTTVSDEGLVLRAFRQAFEVAVPDLWALKSAEFTRYAIDTMGQSKIEVFTAMLGELELAESANREFEAAYLDLIQREGVVEIPGASEVFAELKSRGVLIGLTTGFSRETLDAILASLDWHSFIDASAVPGDVGAGRPSPLMLQKLAHDLQVYPDETVVLGDTQSDMIAGAEFGAAEVIGVLTGTHSQIELLNAGAQNVLESIRTLPNHLFNGN